MVLSHILSLSSDPEMEAKFFANHKLCRNGEIVNKIIGLFAKGWLNGTLTNHEECELHLYLKLFSKRSNNPFDLSLYQTIIDKEYGECGRYEKAFDSWVGMYVKEKVIDYDYAKYYLHILDRFSGIRSDHVILEFTNKYEFYDGLYFADNENQYFKFSNSHTTLTALIHEYVHFIQHMNSQEVSHGETFLYWESFIFDKITCLGWRAFLAR